MNTLICLSINPYASNMRYILYSTTTSTAIYSILLLLAICFIAWKYPAKLHSIGTIAIFWGLLCFSVAMIKVYDTFMFHFGDCSIHAYVFEKMRAQEIFTLDDLRSVESIWKYIATPLSNAITVLLWSTLNYLIARILYIIRTPRI